ncbi:putative transcriptional regulator [Candidatus Burkholderia verschuerenii]|uniref:Putative transcriptional regulator n=1 Tax=Candidatus Burkholderia verschuerenii TaxID=242163 RepID=A0A0L0MIM2_9BURK|nr:helix-turn-helix domain-containing protein [Candidatus Burkholderia verschuerenii]KND62131.1 putative transcriptional regulator [Candidatus Burkholderia verschuerenii]
MQRTTLNKRGTPELSHADVGARLKALRIAHGLSVNELAMRAGVSVGTVSQVERNKANPSVRILEKLRQALEVPLSALLEDDDAVSDPVAGDFVRRAAERPLFEVGKNGMQKELLSPHGDHDLQMMVIMLPAGSGSEEVLVGIGEKAGLVLEGLVVLNVGDRRCELRAGDSFQFKSTVPHSVRNESRKAARLLWIMNTQPPVIHL